MAHKQVHFKSEAREKHPAARKGHRRSRAVTPGRNSKSVSIENYRSDEGVRIDLENAVSVASVLLLTEANPDRGPGAQDRAASAAQTGMEQGF